MKYIKLNQIFSVNLHPMPCIYKIMISQDLDMSLCKLLCSRPMRRFKIWSCLFIYYCPFSEIGWCENLNQLCCMYIPITQLAYNEITPIHHILKNIVEEDLSLKYQSSLIKFEASGLEEFTYFSLKGILK